MWRKGAALLATALVGAAACGPHSAESLFWDGDPNAVVKICSPGVETSCECYDGTLAGKQTCFLDGSGYTSCEGCPSTGTSGGHGGSTGDGGGGGSGTTTTSASSGGGEGGTGGATGCTSPTDCPGDDTACARRTCEDRTCGVEYLPEGTVLVEQTEGDCSERQCDGAGNEIDTVDLTDIEYDDNECTDDTCSAAGPQHEPIETGSACSMGLCQNGSCVDYIPVRCEANGIIHLGCDGTGAWPWTISWFASPTTIERCNDNPGERAYCPAGTPCTIEYFNGSREAGICR